MTVLLHYVGLTILVQVLFTRVATPSSVGTIDRYVMSLCLCLVATNVQRPVNHMQANHVNYRARPHRGREGGFFVMLCFAVVNQLAIVKFFWFGGLVWL